MKLNLHTKLYIYIIIKLTYKKLFSIYNIIILLKFDDTNIIFICIHK